METSGVTLALKAYRINTGSYPSMAEGLEALMTAPADKTRAWQGPYLPQHQWPPLDPWNEPLRYRYPGIHNPSSFDLWSPGPDKRDGTNDDLGNWATAHNVRL